MSYLTFHVVFILPPIVVLGLLVRPRRRDTLILLGLAAIALIYTTPWDNFLVYRNVWSYGADRVRAVIGYVPVEEYAFFILQPLLAGLFFLFLDDRWHDAGGDGHTAERRHESRRKAIRRTGALAGLLLTAFGAWLIVTGAGFYLGLILAWAGPVIAGQWFLAGEWFLQRSAVWGILLPSAYLWIADRFAIDNGIWVISEEHTIGFEPLGLPLEEAVFFLITNVLVVQGIILFRGGNSQARASDSATAQRPDPVTAPASPR